MDWRTDAPEWTRPGSPPPLRRVPGLAHHLRPPQRDDSIVVAVVDDDELLRDALTEMLCIRGYSAFGAADGRALLPAMIDHQPDVVLADVVMPGRINGFDFANLVLREFPRTSVVMMTGYPLLDIDPRKNRCPMLLKPFALDEAVTAIEWAARSR